MCLLGFFHGTMLCFVFNAILFNNDEGRGNIWTAFTFCHATTTKRTALEKPLKTS